MQATLADAHERAQALRFDGTTAPDCYGTPTTRRFARTLYAADGAFPNSPEYAAAIERPRVGPGGEWWLYAACVVAAMACAAAGLAGPGWLALLIGAAVAAWRISRSGR